MFRLARNLEFEEAARLRDRISQLRRLSLGADSERLAG
jgi:excinuclease UvrABC nuclease subunit